MYFKNQVYRELIPTDGPNDWIIAGFCAEHHTQDDMSYRYDLSSNA